jgi:hypothetical protein
MLPGRELPEMLRADLFALDHSDGEVGSTAMISRFQKKPLP